jgi:uncharacterized membrane protein YsdA (DUF1294 family)
MLINNQLLYILIFFFAVNLTSFLVMLIDKKKSSNSNSERISEGALFFLSIFFGSLGIYFGMFICRHKTRKWYFMMGVPFLIIQNIALLYLLYLFLLGESVLFIQ